MKLTEFRNAISLITSFLLLSCNSQYELNEGDKIFHAAQASGGIGSIHFALYKGHKYQVCESGGLGHGCYTGKFSLMGDTIIFQDLDKECYLKNNRLLICKYDKLDSTYWQWKYPRHLINWQIMKERDIAAGNEGDVYQLDKQNNKILDPTYHFVIKMDSLKNNR
jgi:hypothetical protein